MARCSVTSTARPCRPGQISTTSRCSRPGPRSTRTSSWRCSRTMRWLNDPAAQTMVPNLGKVRQGTERQMPNVSPDAYPDLRDAAERIRAALREPRRGHREDRRHGQDGQLRVGDLGRQDRLRQPDGLLGAADGLDDPVDRCRGLDPRRRNRDLRHDRARRSRSSSSAARRTTPGRCRWSRPHPGLVPRLAAEPSSSTDEETIHPAGGDPVTIPIYRSHHGPIVDPYPYDPDNPPDFDRFVGLRPLGTRGGHRRVDARFRARDEHGGVRRGRRKRRAPASTSPMPTGTATSPTGCRAGTRSGRQASHPALPAGRRRHPGVDRRASPVGARREYRRRATTAAGTTRRRSTTTTRPNNLWYNIGPFHRAHVVEDYLSTHDDLTFEEVRDLALNIATTDSFMSGGNTWSFVADTFKAAVAADPSPDRDAAIAMLDAWDGHFVAGGPAEWRMGTLRADAWVLQDAWIQRGFASDLRGRVHDGRAWTGASQPEGHSLQRPAARPRGRRCLAADLLRLVPGQVGLRKTDNRRGHHRAGARQRDSRHGFGTVRRSRAATSSSDTRSWGQLDPAFAATSRDRRSRAARPTPTWSSSERTARSASRACSHSASRVSSTTSVPSCRPLTPTTSPWRRPTIHSCRARFRCLSDAMCSDIFFAFRADFDRIEEWRKE